MKELDIRYRLLSVVGLFAVTLCLTGCCEILEAAGCQIQADDEGDDSCAACCDREHYASSQVTGEQCYCVGNTVDWSTHNHSFEDSDEGNSQVCDGAYEEPYEEELNECTD